MVRVVLSHRAERWFLRKVAELAAVNPGAAYKLIDRLERQKELLSAFPDMTEKGLVPGTRKVSMPPLVLTIRLLGDVVQIAAIRDGRQRDALAPEDVPPPELDGDG